MKIRFAKYMIGGSLLLAGITCYDVSKSCGPELGLDEARFALFRNNLTNQSELQPFYYSERFMNAYEPDPAKNDYKRNCKEWQLFTGNSVSEKDIYALQYQTSPEDFLEAYNTANWKPFTNNSFAHWLQQKQNNAALLYFVMAKRAEFFQFQNSDPWNTGQTEEPAEIKNIVSFAYAKTASAIPQFLKERYAFQVIKQAYYSGNRTKGFKDSVKLCYNTFLKNSPSVVAAWTQVFYSGFQPKETQRTSYLLQAFDRCDEKKIFVFQHVSLTDLNALEAITKDSKTLALIHVFKAMKNPGRASKEIATVYQYNPQSKYLPLLVTREINKLEDWITSWQQLGFNSFTQAAVYENEQYKKHNSHNEFPFYESIAAKNRRKDQQYLRSFLQQLQQMSYSSKKGQAFYLLAQAHLQNMDGNYAAAKQLCVTIETTDKAIETQKLIEATIALVNTENILLPEVKEEIALNVKRLIQLNPEFQKKVADLNDVVERYDETATAENNDDLSELMLLVSNRYHKLGDIVTAGLIYNRYYLLTNQFDGYLWRNDDSCNYFHLSYFDRYASPQDIDKLLSFKYQREKSGFEKLITPALWAKDDFYKDLKGTILFRRKQYKEALAVFNTMPDTFWRGNYAYAEYMKQSSVKLAGYLMPGENIRIADYPYESKKLIAQDFVQLTNSIDTTSNPAAKAKLLYQLGNAFFNTGYYGKDWMMFSYGKTSYEFDVNRKDNYAFANFNFYPNGTIYKDRYYRCSDAITAYTKALRLSVDKELSAQCVLMLSCCDARRHESDKYFSNARWWADDDKRYVSPWLQRLKKNYSETKLFERSSTTCPDVMELAKK